MKRWRARLALPRQPAEFLHRCDESTTRRRPLMYCHASVTLLSQKAGEILTNEPGDGTGAPGPRRASASRGALAAGLFSSGEVPAFSHRLRSRTEIVGVRSPMVTPNLLATTLATRITAL